MQSQTHVDFSILYMLCWVALSCLLWAIIIGATWEVLSLV